MSRIKIATNEYISNSDGDKTDHTEWHNIVTWNKTADFVSDNLDKGDIFFLSDTEILVVSKIFFRYVSFNFLD